MTRLAALLLLAALLSTPEAALQAEPAAKPKLAASTGTFPTHGPADQPEALVVKRQVLRSSR